MYLNLLRMVKRALITTEKKKKRKDVERKYYFH